MASSVPTDHSPTPKVQLQLTTETTDPPKQSPASAVTDVSHAPTPTAGETKSPTTEDPAKLAKIVSFTGSVQPQQSPSAASAPQTSASPTHDTQNEGEGDAKQETSNPETPASVSAPTTEKEKGKNGAGDTKKLGSTTKGPGSPTKRSASSSAKPRVGGGTGFMSDSENKRAGRSASKASRDVFSDSENTRQRRLTIRSQGDQPKQATELSSAGDAGGVGGLQSPTAMTGSIAARRSKTAEEKFLERQWKKKFTKDDFVNLLKKVTALEKEKEQMTVRMREQDSQIQRLQHEGRRKEDELGAIKQKLFHTETQVQNQAQKAQEAKQSLQQLQERSKEEIAQKQRALIALKSNYAATESRTQDNDYDVRLLNNKKRANDEKPAGPPQVVEGNVESGEPSAAGSTFMTLVDDPLADSEFSAVDASQQASRPRGRSNRPKGESSSAPVTLEGGETGNPQDSAIVTSVASSPADPTIVAGTKPPKNPKPTQAFVRRRHIPPEVMEVLKAGQDITNREKMTELELDNARLKKEVLKLRTRLARAQDQMKAQEAERVAGAKDKEEAEAAAAAATEGEGKKKRGKLVRPGKMADLKVAGPHIPSLEGIQDVLNVVSSKPTEVLSDETGVKLPPRRPRHVSKKEKNPYTALLEGNHADTEEEPTSPHALPPIDKKPGGIASPAPVASKKREEKGVVSKPRHSNSVDHKDPTAEAAAKPSKRSMSMDHKPRSTKSKKAEDSEHKPHKSSTSTDPTPPAQPVVDDALHLPPGEETTPELADEKKPTTPSKPHSDPAKTPEGPSLAPPTQPAGIPPRSPSKPQDTISTPPAAPSTPKA